MLLEKLQRAWRRQRRATREVVKRTSRRLARADGSNPVKQVLTLVSDRTSLPPIPGTPPSPLPKDERLPDVLWKPEDEFPGATTINQSLMNMSRESQILRRLARVATRSIMQPRRLMLLAGCSVGVVGLTSYEAHLLLDPTCSWVDALHFTYTYSIENALYSSVWETFDAELVARSIGLDPEELLREIDAAKSQDDARLTIRLENLFTTRTVIVSFMLITQLASIVREIMLAGQEYGRNIYHGREPPLVGIKERVIRLAGDGSDVTEVSMRHYGAHILPVYENALKWKYLVRQWSLQGRRPAVWQVPAGHYGYRHSWAKLRIDSSYMLRTTTGKNVLCIEADATNLDRAHELQHPTSDVTIDEAAQAYRMVERAASKQMQRPFRSLCVFLGDSLQMVDTGGTTQVTLRERVDLKQEVHVLIDSRAPLLLAILKWCSRFVDKHRTIVLDATPNNYAPLQLLLEMNGYTVLSPSQAADWKPPPTPAVNAKEVDTGSSAEATPSTESEEFKRREQAAPSSAKDTPGNPVTVRAPGNGSKREGEGNGKNELSSSAVSASSSSSSSSSSSPSSSSSSPSSLPGAKPTTTPIADKREKLPRLIYYPTTAATINAVHSVISAGLALPHHCCVLINSPFGMLHLEEIAEHANEDFHAVCAADIYDDYFRQVRIWTRMGHSAGAIQRELDERFAPVLPVQSEISRLPRSLPSDEREG